MAAKALLFAVVFFCVFVLSLRKINAGNELVLGVTYAYALHISSFVNIVPVNADMWAILRVVLI